MIRLFSKLLLWILRKIRREQREQQALQEEILQRKKREEDAIAHEEWKEKLDRAYKECSSYGKKKAYKRSYYHRRKSAH